MTTNTSGNTIERTDYYPYGSISSSGITQDIGNKYKYTGKELDSETNLSYFGARYYNQSVGRFMGIDPATLALTSSQFKQLYGQDLYQYLADPQNLNGYAYSRNNPVILVDPNGQSWETFGQGLASPFVYGYNHPLETVGVLLVGAVVVTTAPVAAVVIGTALGGIAIGTAIGNAMNAADSNSRDYYLGQATTLSALTAIGIKGGGSLSGVKQGSTGGLLDNTFVCRGGSCEIGSFQADKRVYIEADPDAVVNGISVRAGNGKTIPELTKGLPQSSVGVVTAKDIARLGGNLVQDGSNPNHFVINGLTNRILSNIYEGRVILNPNK